jgi:hypothetical protein
VNTFSRKRRYDFREFCIGKYREAQLEPFAAEDAEVAEITQWPCVLRELCGEKLLAAKTLGINRFMYL